MLEMNKPMDLFYKLIFDGKSNFANDYREEMERARLRGTAVEFFVFNFGFLFYGFGSGREFIDGMIESIVIISCSPYSY